MPEKIAVEFKYRIGDEVTSKAMVSPFRSDANEQLLRKAGERALPPQPQKMVVVGQVAETCIGGIQLHYRVRIYSLGSSGWRASEVGLHRDPFLVSEFELMPWAEAIAEPAPPSDAPA